MQYSDTIGRIVSDMWIVFVIVWIISAFFAKRYAKRAGGQWALFRIVVMVVIVIFIETVGIRQSLLLGYIHNETIRTIGAILTFIGIATAIWARYYLGRNWGMPMSEKAGAELVTTGPYAYIRHPIYSGITLAVIGTALVLGNVWAIALVLYIIYFLISVPREDAIMARLFPDTYPAYKARTKRLIPWVW